jgi:hypothetical protein
VRCEMWRRPRSIRVPASKKRTARARARQRRGRDETRGTGSISRINQLSRQRPQSTRIIHRQRERSTRSTSRGQDGWLEQSEDGGSDQQRRKGACVGKRAGAEGERDSPRPWLTKTQEHPVQAPAALWIAGIFELTSKGYRDQNTDLATRD